MSSPTGHNRFAVLDVLRVIAVVGVIAAHFAWSAEWVTENLGQTPVSAFGGIAEISAYGFLGVHLFFVISGTVIARSAVGRTARGFVIARFLRLMPALLIAVPFSAVFIIIAGGADIPSTIRSVMTNLALLPSLADSGWLNPVFWTLVVEASFYGIVALVVLVWGSSRRVLWRFAWVWLGAIIVASRADNDVLNTVLLADWAPFFIAGILIGTASSRADRAAAIVGLAAAGLLAVDSTLATMNPEGRSVTAIFVVVVGILLFVAASVWWAPLSSLHSSSWAFIGTMTYSLYLFHVRPGRMIAVWMLKSGGGVLLSYATGIGVAVALSIVVTRFVEPPLRQWMKTALTR